MTSTKWSENDDLFFREARIGQAYIERVGARLRQAGLDPTVPELRLRPTIDQAPEYLDTKDILCAGKILEVKSRRVRFHGPDDFPYDTILVDTVSGWEAKDEKPFAYVCISQITDAIIATRGHDSTPWVVQRKWDNVRRIEDDFYLAPRECWRTFDSLVAALKELQA